jgi:hypothetical protein
MESWLPFFVIVASLAMTVQMVILILMYLQFRQMNERMTRIASDFQSKVEPILTRVNSLLEDSHGRITSMVADTAEIVHLARGQAQKVDRVFTEAVDRLRLQIIRADQLLTGAMEQLEEAGVQFRKTVLEPVQKASAFIKGVQAGLEVFRGHRRSPERAREHQDEELFI